MHTATQTSLSTDSPVTPSSKPSWKADLKLTFSPSLHAIHKAEIVSDSSEIEEANQAAYYQAGALGKTKLSRREQFGPLSVQRPFYPEKTGACHLYLLHPPGGVVGGDELHITAKTQAGAHALVTTPGATKFYRHNGHFSKQVQDLTVAQGSFLEWLPQENIFFNDAKAHLETHIYLETDALFLGWEMHCFGRPALKECFELGQLTGKTQIFDAKDPQNPELILTEQLNLKGDDALMREVGLQGFQMLGSFFITPKDDQEFELVQNLLLDIQTQQPRTELVISCTKIERLIVIRAWSNWSEPMQQAFCQIWQAVRMHWFGECPDIPRIWAT